MRKLDVRGAHSERADFLSHRVVAQRFEESPHRGRWRRFSTSRKS